MTLFEKVKVSGELGQLQCQWINDSDKTACFLCNAKDRFVEIL